MAQDLEELLEEYSVPFITTGKNTSRNFVNVSCADSGGDCSYDDNYTMGISRSMTHGYCWYCARAFPVFDTKERQGIATTLGIEQNMWKQVMEEQDGELYTEGIIQHEEIKDDTPDVEVPGDTLHEVHRNYLKGRGLDPDWLIKEYGITGTINYPDDYKKGYRVFFPIRHKGKIVSYVGRSYLDSAMNKYMCCDKSDELYFHKNLLFNQDRVTGRKGIAVEGPLDVLNLVQASGNFNIVAFYGTSYKDEQVQQLRKLFDEVFVIFDPEPAAQEKAMNIKSYLESYGVKCTVLCFKKNIDPGALPHKTAKALVEHYLGKEN
jgi:hypothetical protein